MKKISVLILISLLFYTSFFINKNVDAAQFSQTLLRLDRTKSNSPLSGTVCASPSSAGAGIENKVIINFPSDFTINNDVSLFTTNTSDLPSDSVAWPGIGNIATQIAENTVTLASDDLTTLNLYCFNFIANASTTGSIGKKNGLITTKNFSNATIDLMDYGITILTNDQIKINAIVPAKATDFLTVINLLNPPRLGGVYPENTQMEYRITYGSYLNYPISMTIEASWSLGRIEGQINPSVNILNYVVGSATNAYNSTPPIIDTLNRTITWEITAFPGDFSPQTLRFNVITTDSFSQDKKVDFNVSARTFFPGGVTPYVNSSSSYKYSRYIPAPPPTSTNTPSNQVTQSPVPSPIINPVIQNIEVREITYDKASVYVKTNTKTSKIIKYGTSINSLFNQVASSNLNLSDNLVLKDLRKSRKYYFRVYVTDSNGKQMVSDIYTFTTARDSTPLQADPKTLVAASRNTIISPFSFENFNYLVIPVITPLQFKFSILNKNTAKFARAIVRNKNLLGDSTFIKTLEENIDLIDLVEVEKGVYSGNMLSDQKPGNYELFTRIIDSNGNVKEQKIADLKVIDKFKVISNNQPIEGARVLIYIYNPSTKIYQIMPSSSIEAGNPLFTNSQGELDLVLPQGRYKAEISDLRHSEKRVEFEIGPKIGQQYPIVYLEKTGITLPGFINYYKRSINDVFIFNTKNYSSALTGSTRFFDLIALLSLTGLVILTLFAFSKRHHVPLFKMPSYFYYLLDKKSKNDKYVHGVVYDENDQPIPSANVYLTDKQDEKIISSTKTNKRGEFFFKKKGKSNEYFIMAMAKNFMPSPVLEYHEKEHLKFRLTLEEETKQLYLINQINHLVSVMIGMSFEVLLIASFVFELLFLNSFGLLKTLPFLLISIFNLVIWTLHQKNK